MKKILYASAAVMLTAAFTATAVHALTPYQMEKYGQKTYYAYEAGEIKPVVDGIVTEAEYGAPIAVYNYGDEGCYWSGEDYDEATLKQLIPKDVSLYVTYDNEYFYLGVTCRDDSHYTPNPGTDVWDGDYLEFDILLFQDSFDMNANKIRYALGTTNDGDTTGYFAAIPEYCEPLYSVNEEIDDPSYNQVSVKDGLTTYEARISWKELLGMDGDAGQAMFYMQLGCSSEALYEQSEYAAYLGVFRCAAQLTDEQIAEIEAQGITEGSYKLAYPIVKFAGPRPVAAETPVETDDDTAVSDAVSTPVQNAPVTADMGIAVSAVAMASAAAAVLSKKRR